MRDELLAGRRANLQRPGAPGVAPEEIVGLARCCIDIGPHFGEQHIRHGLRHERLDDRHNRRSERRSKIGSGCVRCEARSISRSGGGASCNSSQMETVVLDRINQPATELRLNS